MTPTEFTSVGVAGGTQSAYSLQLFESDLAHGTREAMEAAARIFDVLFKHFETRPAIRLWDCGIATPTSLESPFTLVWRDPLLLRRMVLESDPLLLADAYFRGALDVEGDLYSAIGLKDHFTAAFLSWRERLALLRDGLGLPLLNAGRQVGNYESRSQRAPYFARLHSRVSDSAAIAFHYDVSNEFFSTWLDKQMVYSCGVFERPEQTLEMAQCNKLDLICRKLRLEPGEDFLDVGCGWGALVCWAARQYGVHAHGITLSAAQLEYAMKRIRAEGLQGQVTVELCDYRDLKDTLSYDKVASVGMFEHVGLKNMRKYLEKVHRILRPGGLFLNHGITHDEEGWSKTMAAEFINRYVFPNGELDCISNIQLGMERVGFEIHDVEGLRPHYALTLRHWVERLEANRENALSVVDEKTYRVWKLYMAACALEFESGGTGVYQILSSRRDRGRWPIPMSRSDIYHIDRSGN